MIHLDFETRSEVDIRSAGVWRYAEHPSTEIVCLAVARDDRPPVLYREHEIETFVTHARKYENEMWAAHNAEFEMAIITHKLVPLGFKKPDPTQWVCTAAMAAYQGLPRSLGEAAKALNLPDQKDSAGTYLLNKICKPKPGGGFRKYDDCPEDFDALYEYCLQDVRTEQAIGRALPSLPTFEKGIWDLHYRINERGFDVDLVAAAEFLRLVEEFKDINSPLIKQYTDGEVKGIAQVAALLDWLFWQWVPLPDLQKATVENALGDFEGRFPHGSEAAKKVLQLRQTLSSAAVKKYNAIFRQVSEDDRIRGCFLYYGAGTGRWSGKGLQPQNLKRPTIDIETATTYVVEQKPSIEEFMERYPEPLDAIASCIRATIVAPPGKKFVGGDESAIEARGTAYIAQETTALDVFRRGDDPYLINAETIFGYPVNKKEHPEERQTGKVAELALGYQGGIAAFVKFARGYKLNLERMSQLILAQGGTDDERDRAERAYSQYLARADYPVPKHQALACDLVKQRWRAAHPRTVQFWADVEEAARGAVANPGVSYPCGKGIVFRRDEQWLRCQLPSGRYINYFRPVFRDAVTPWGDAASLLAYDTGERKQGKIVWKGLYGGLLTENIVQAVARDILAEGLLRLVRRPEYEIVLHVHDEGLAKIPESLPDEEAMAYLKRCMETPPKWAPDIPLSVEPWIGTRYRK